MIEDVTVIATGDAPEERTKEMTEVQPVSRYGPSDLEECDCNIGTMASVSAPAVMRLFLLSDA